MTKRDARKTQQEGRIDGEVQMEQIRLALMVAFVAFFAGDFKRGEM